jgi:hypothetical protein
MINSYLSYINIEFMSRSDQYKHVNRVAKGTVELCIDN